SLRFPTQSTAPPAPSRSYTLSLLRFSPRFFVSRKCHRASHGSGKSSPRCAPWFLLPLHPCHQHPHRHPRPPVPCRLLLRAHDKPHNLTPQRRRHPAKLRLRPRCQPQRHRQRRWHCRFPRLLVPLQRHLHNCSRIHMQFLPDLPVNGQPVASPPPRPQRRSHRHAFHRPLHRHIHFARVHLARHLRRYIHIPDDSHLINSPRENVDRFPHRPTARFTQKLSSRPERPDFLSRAALRRVGPRSGGICFSPLLLSLCSLSSSLCDRRLPRPGRGVTVSLFFSFPKPKTDH